MNYYGIWARRSGGSIFGAAEGWCKDADGEYIVRGTYEEAKAMAGDYNKNTRSCHVQYFPQAMSQELAEGILARQAQAQEDSGMGINMT